MQCSMSFSSRAWATRAYATQVSGKRLGKTISLDHFLQRSKAISLWRSIIRDCRRVSDPTTRKETVAFARDEFKRNKDVQDITQIRYLISTGKTQWETMSRYIDGL